MLPGLRPQRTSGLALVLALLALAAPLRASGLVDPLLRFRQVRTEHFVIYFHQGEEHLAARLAAIVEDVRARVGRDLNTTPSRLTHVILADQAEAANGWATPTPRDTVFLHAAVPSGDEFIGRADDWLRVVFTHEYTHVVHLGLSGGWARPVRGIFGRVPIAFPNLWLPQWQIEGLATWEESALTGEGRLHAGDFRAIERVPAADGRVLSLDRASGGLVGWPDGHAAYAAGLGFHAYLVDRFGQPSLGTLAASTARRLPFFGTPAFGRVYGQSLGSLWRDYGLQLVAANASPVAEPGAPRRLSRHGNIVVAPRFAPPTCDACPLQIVYSARTPDAFPSLRTMDVDGRDDRRLSTRYQGSTVGVRRASIVFDQQEVRRNVGLYSDLYVLDRRTGDVRALTTGARLQDPDLSPDGRSIAAVRENRGQRELVVAQLRGSADDPSGMQLAEVETVASAADTQFGAPRWSPDGRSLVAERHRLGSLSEVVVLDVASRQVGRAFADQGARIVTPTWRPDGRAIIAAADFDERAFDLYEFPLEGESIARRLTRTSGALWPDVSPDGRTIVFTGYTADGYDVFAAPYALFQEDAPRALTASSPPAPSTAGPDDALSARPYSPLGTLAPTLWTPLVLADSEQTRVGASVTGADVLARHAYAVNLTWLVHGPQVARPVDQSVPDWSLAYAYTRWQPSLFGSVSRETLFRTFVDDAASDLISAGGVQQEYQAGVLLPWRRVRHTTQGLASLVRTDVRYHLIDTERATTLVSTRLALSHDTTQRYGYSISRERGVNIGTTVELARKALGSSAEGTTVTLDARAYMPGFGLHHVVALRGAAATSRGSDLARQVFQLGGVAASGSVIDFSSDALGLLRGARGQTVAGTRLLVANAEYRFPLAVLERGRGTLPLFLRTAHASIFGDLGQVRGDGQGDGVWRRAVGGELSLDAVAGYALPFVASVGVAWGHDGRSARGASVYARLGRAF